MVRRHEFPKFCKLGNWQGGILSIVQTSVFTSLLSLGHQLLSGEGEASALELCRVFIHAPCPMRSHGKWFIFIRTSLLRQSTWEVIRHLLAKISPRSIFICKVQRKNSSNLGEDESDSEQIGNLWVSKEVF